MRTDVTVVGAGLAGSEAAWQLAKSGFSVRLVDQKPKKCSPAHKNPDFAELVCSNSLRSDRLSNATGLLKQELRLLDSLILRAADATRIPAGGALAVDRAGFAQTVTRALREHPNIQIVCEEIRALPPAPCIIATGPLTDGPFYHAVEERLGKSFLHFHDAAAPIVLKESLDFTKIFPASRYGRGADYLNCPMTREEYFAFYHELLGAQRAPLHAFEAAASAKIKVKVFEGCMPVEVMARRGERTLAFGPLKPVGLLDPRTGRRPYAVAQLRQDDARGTLYNLVGFQTNLTFPEQRRVFGLIPGLENAEYARYGVMHRNTFLASPGLLNAHYRLRGEAAMYFAGQITGVEGYIESASSGLVAGIALGAELAGQPSPNWPEETAIGALARYVSEYRGGDFQPMNVNFGLLPPLEQELRGKEERYLALSERALKRISGIAGDLR